MIYESIPGGPALLAWFGQEPSFHDAEILSINLVDQPEHAPGPRLDHPNQVDDHGYLVLDRHTVVTFTLEDIMDVQLDGFSPQNVISGLRLQWRLIVAEASLWRGLSRRTTLQIELEPCYGLDSVIRAKRVSIAS